MNYGTKLSSMVESDQQIAHMNQPDRNIGVTTLRELEAARRPWDGLFPLQNYGNQSFADIARSLPKLHERLSSSMGGIASMRFTEAAALLSSPVDKFIMRINSNREVREISLPCAVRQIDMSKKPGGLYLHPDRLDANLSRALRILARSIPDPFDSNKDAWSVNHDHTPLIEPHTGGFQLVVDHSTPSLDLLETWDFGGTIPIEADIQIPAFTWSAIIGTQLPRKLSIKEHMVRGVREYQVKIQHVKNSAYRETFTMNPFTVKPFVMQYMRSSAGEVDIEAFAEIDNRGKGRWQVDVDTHEMAGLELRDAGINVRSQEAPNPRAIVEKVLAAARLLCGTR